MEYAISPRAPAELRPQSRSPRTAPTPGNFDVAAARAGSGPLPLTGVPFQYQDKSAETQRKMTAQALTEYTVSE